MLAALEAERQRKIAEEKEKWAIKDYVDIKLNCTLIKVEPQTAELISVGDKEIDLRGEILGEVVNIGRASPYIHNVYIGLGFAPPLLKRSDPR